MCSSIDSSYCIRTFNTALEEELEQLVIILRALELTLHNAREYSHVYQFGRPAPGVKVCV